MNIQFVCGTSFSAIGLCFLPVCCFSYKSSRLAGNEKKLTVFLRKGPKEVRMGNVRWTHAPEYNASDIHGY